MDEVYRNDDGVVEKAVRELMHHFDAVQIFATRHETATDGPRTIGISKGGGNYFSRAGIVEKWLRDELGAVDPEEYQDDYENTDLDDPEED